MPTPLEARLTEENEALRAQNKAQQIENKLLREKIDLLVRRVFGAKSEQLEPLATGAVEELRPYLDMLELHQPRECVADVVGVRRHKP